MSEQRTFMTVVSPEVDFTYKSAIDEEQIYVAISEEPHRANLQFDSPEDGIAFAEALRDEIMEWQGRDPNEPDEVEIYDDQTGDDLI